MDKFKGDEFNGGDEVDHRGEDGFRLVVGKYWKSMVTRTKRQSLVDIINVQLWDLENASFEAKIGEALKEAWRNL